METSRQPLELSLHTTNSTTITATTILRLLVRDYPGELVPEETFTHSHLFYHQSSFISFLYLLQSTLFNLRA